MGDKTATSFTGVVLAGGASRRMGHDKALLKCGEVTMLKHIEGRLAAAGAKDIVVLGRTDVPNGQPDRLPLEGPAIALQDYLASRPEGTRHLVVPVDMPAISSALLARLAAENAWASYDGHPLPCLAVADGNTFVTIRRLRTLMRLNNASAVPCPRHMEWRFANINTPRDYEAFGELSSIAG